jgi:hypothetical protein
MKLFYTVFFFIFIGSAFAQTTLTVDATANHKPISPWIYGRNNNLSDDPASPLTAAQWQLYKDAGLRMYRESTGNNSTKYNWRLKLTSHPDWFNNVYAHDWDFVASSLLSNTSNTQGLFAFQLLGMSASNTAHNFNDWQYTQDNGNINTNANWAGGGGPVAYGGNGGNGNPNLYLEKWTADSTAKILDHWFNEQGLDKSRLTYWSMDNEPEVWANEHDDIASSAITAEVYMQKYFAVAKAVRAKFPGIKLLGPVSTNEWQWYNWNNTKVIDPTDGQEYPWMQYFIKRIAEEEAATGIRLLDVLDIHFYPGTQDDPTTTLQLHRLWFDTLYSYPKANGVRVTSSTGWDINITQEYFYERCNRWLTQYKGPSHGVTFSMSECGSIANQGSEDPNMIACWYASQLGVFANNGVELFTPWDWYEGQWEVLHLFSNYFGNTSIKTSSTNDSIVSGYSSLTQNGDSLVIAIVNRSQNNAQNVTVDIKNFIPSENSVTGYSLSGLPGSETFVSKTNNALQSGQYTISANQITFSAPKLSVTLIQIPTDQAIPIVTSSGGTTGGGTTTGTRLKVNQSDNVNIFPNPTKNLLQIDMNDGGGSYQLILQNMVGQTVQTSNFSGDTQIDVSAYPAGQYIIQIIQDDAITVKKFVKE